MSRIHIDLEGKDRCINLEVKTALGTYFVNLEFLGHEYGEGSDDVQVNIYKPTQHNEMGINGIPVEGPNSIVRGDNRGGPIFTKSPEDHNASGIWYEFHQVGNLPPVRSFDKP
jgi:hypothetical protein